MTCQHQHASKKVREKANNKSEKSSAEEAIKHPTDQPTATKTTCKKVKCCSCKAAMLLPLLFRLTRPMKEKQMETKHGKETNGRRKGNGKNKILDAMKLEAVRPSLCMRCTARGNIAIDASSKCESQNSTCLTRLLKLAALYRVALGVALRYFFVLNL